MAKPFHVALLVEPSTSFGRGVLRGVARFARSRPNWVFAFEHAASTHEMAACLRGLHAIDGLIVRRVTGDLAEHIRKARVTTVKVGMERAHPRLPLVTIHNAAVGEMVAGYFFQRGYRRLAAVGFPDRLFSKQRIDAFGKALRKRGLSVEECRLDFDTWQGLETSHRMAMLEPWLTSLAGPVGVLACNDEVGRYVTEACRRIGRDVPEDIAVVGVDNDEVLCELSNPPLSSVELGAERIGYAAARLLERLRLRAEEGRARPILLDPVGVVTRRSSDQIAVDDPLVADALRYIWEHAPGGIDVPDLVQHMGVSRRWLEVRFRRTLGCSPAVQIRHVRLERAKRLLAETDLLIPQVAKFSGFGDAKLLIAVFRRMVGMQPTAYRRKYRLR